ncbi:hypothetical protein EVAR_58465_1 [Eumeta japonica]|uniref:Uncharacterized protein n=1 Tax=Eumeta variegata TaxID=151549 RepID=A0A4C1YK33_EUMVA|nr:hypothetical protein EVAR_58465_1 [Eumeta japonica]
MSKGRGKMFAGRGAGAAQRPDGAQSRRSFLLFIISPRRPASRAVVRNCILVVGLYTSVVLMKFWFLLCSNFSEGLPSAFNQEIKQEVEKWQGIQ